jgi:hypothetical protein
LDLPFLTEHGNHSTFPSNRNRHQPGAGPAACPRCDLAFEALTGGCGLFEEAGAAGRPCADVVSDIHGLVRGRTDLVNNNPLPIIRPDVKQEVGEAEISEKRPLGAKPLQMIDVVVIE